MRLPQKSIAYGVCLEADFPWPWAPAAPDGSAPQLRVRFGDSASQVTRPDSGYRLHALRPSHNADAAPIVRVERNDAGLFRVSYADGAVFTVDATSAEIHGTSRSGMSVDDLLVYLQGPIFGFLLRLRGITCLHASAAVAHGGAFALVGGAGMGKSTTIASFAQLGLPVLTDDVLALDEVGGDFWVQPGLPRVMLWPASVDALWGDTNALPLVVDGWEKRYLALDQPGYQFAQTRAKLDAIYVLAERSTDTSTPEFSSMTGTDAIVTLIGNTYANDLLDTPMRARELEVLGRLASTVPVRKLRVPDDRAAITRVRDMILADFERVRER